MGSGGQNGRHSCHKPVGEPKKEVVVVVRAELGQITLVQELEGVQIQKAE